jgi:hypothetical protein
MQKITVMAALPIGTLDPHLAFEQGYVRKGPTETLETLLGQGVLDVDPWVGSLPLEGFRRDSLDTFMIQIFHTSPIEFRQFILEVVIRDFPSGLPAHCEYTPRGRAGSALPNPPFRFPTRQDSSV